MILKENPYNEIDVRYDCKNILGTRNQHRTPTNSDPNSNPVVLSKRPLFKT